MLKRSGEALEGGRGGGAADLRRMAAARAARAWARSSWSSLEPRKKGLVGDWSREAMGAFCLAGVTASAISISPTDNCAEIGEELGLGFWKRNLGCSCGREEERLGREKEGGRDFGFFPSLSVV